METNARPYEGKMTLLARSVPLTTAMVLTLLGASGIAHAKDAVRTQITNSDGGIVTENGAFQTPGTYAIGTIKVDYLVVGHQFPADAPFHTFEMCLDTLEGKARPATSYPATVNLRQVGTPNVNLGLSSSALAFGGVSEEHCIDVSVSVPGDVANDLDFQEDGTKLVANLQISTPPRTHLDTVTTVKVQLTLVHPSASACVRSLHLVSNQGFDSSLSDNGISVNLNTSNGNLSSSPNDLQHLLALVNSCDHDVYVDIDTAINENFSLHQSNAVRTTAINQEIVDVDALLAHGLGWDELTNQGTGMCLSNVQVPSEQTFVLAQRNRILTNGKFPGEHAASIDRDVGGWEYDGFTFSTHISSGVPCAALALSSDVDPSAGEVIVPVNAVTFSGSGSLPTETPPE